MGLIKAILYLVSGLAAFAVMIAGGVFAIIMGLLTGIAAVGGLVITIVVVGVKDLLEAKRKPP